MRRWKPIIVMSIFAAALMLSGCLETVDRALEGKRLVVQTMKAVKAGICDNLEVDHPARVQIRDVLAKAPGDTLEFARLYGVDPYCPDSPR